MESFENSNDNMLFLEMKTRFPNLPEEKISQTIKKVSGNRETCYKILFHENNVNRQNSTQNNLYAQNTPVSSTRTESRFFPTQLGSESAFPSSMWPNPNMGRQSSYPSYAYNGGGKSVFQPSGLTNIKSAPVGVNNRDTFSIAYNSQMHRSQTSPYNLESSYDNNQPPPYPGSVGVRTFVETESNNYGSTKMTNSPTRHISTLHIDPAPPYPPSQFQYFTRTVGASSSGSHSPLGQSPQTTRSTSVNFKVSPNKDNHPSFQFSATPGHSYSPSAGNRLEENPHLRISISSSGRGEGNLGSNRYQLFPEHDQRASNYQYDESSPPRPPTSREKNYSPSLASPKIQIGMNVNKSQSGSSLPHSLNPRDQPIKPNYYKPILPGIGPISKPYPTNPGEEAEYNRVLIAHQKAGLDLLKRELESSKDELTNLKMEVYSKERLLIYSQCNVRVNPDEMQKLREEITKLRVECHCLSVEVDRQMNSQVPLGVTDADFYNNIFTGQVPGSNITGHVVGVVAQSAGAIATAIPTASQGVVKVVETTNTREKSSSSHRTPCGIPTELEEDEEEKIKWNCPKCTYLNHPDLNVCEICETERPPFAVDSM